MGTVSFELFRFKNKTNNKTAGTSVKETSTNVITAKTVIVISYLAAWAKSRSGYSRETAEHYLLHCPNYLNIRARTILTLPSNQTNIRTLLYGNLDLRLPENKHIFLTVHEFIKLSKRL